VRRIQGRANDENPFASAQVFLHADVIPSVLTEQIDERGRLTVPEFGEKPGPWAIGRMRSRFKKPGALGRQMSVGGQTVGPAIECEDRIVIADLGLQMGQVGCGDVGGIGDDEIEGTAASEGRVGGEGVELQEMDGGFDARRSGVFASDGKGGGRDVDGGDPGPSEQAGQRDGDAAGSGADVEDAERGIGRDAAGREEDKLFGFGARDEDVG